MTTPITGDRSMVTPRDYGWRKIKSVSVLRDDDECGRTLFEAVEIVDEDYEWFMVGILHTDPSADELAAHYIARGWTDARCVHMGPAAL